MVMGVDIQACNLHSCRSLGHLLAVAPPTMRCTKPVSELMHAPCTVCI